METKMGSSTLNNVLKRIGVKAGVTDVNIQAHTFRHTLVTALKSAGNDMETVSKFMGHNSVDTTINYYWEK
ncbi:MAG: site-specific integrase, partial [Candidatus Pacebacteria bacterium]|nr:site-specific integrase [Candidatus Paceibacterota bacterium]